MLIDMCPYISEKLGSKRCPKCRVEPNEAEKAEPLDVIGSCLSKISETIGSFGGMKNEVTVQKRIAFELFKLRRITTLEEERRLTVTNKKNALEMVARMEQLLYPEDSEEKAQLLSDIGDIYFNIKEFDRALLRFKQASELEPRNKRLWNNMGVIMSREGRTTDALGYYDKALKLDPGFGSAWFNKGKTLFKQGEMGLALKCFRNATKFTPENKSAWNNLGVTLRQLKRYKESIRCYDEVLKIHPSYPWAWHNKGVALMELKRYKEAMHCFDRALQLDPDFEPSLDSKRQVMRKLM